MFNFNDHLQELRATIVALVLMLATFIIGLIWISIGLYHGLTGWLGAVWGPVCLGGLFFLPLIMYALINTFGQRRATGEPAITTKPADDALANMAKVFDSLSGHSPFLVATAAIIAGFLAARFPSLLTLFTQILTAYADDIKHRAASNPPHSEGDENR